MVWWLYRFTPETWDDVSSGTLQVLADDGAGGLRWGTAPNPTGTGPQPHLQVPEAIRFDGAEGIRRHRLDSLLHDQGRQPDLGARSRDDDAVGAVRRRQQPEPGVDRS